MLSDPVERVHRNFLARVAAGDLPPPRAVDPTDDDLDRELDGTTALALFRAQVLSRHLDRLARELRAAGDGYYTIGSSGHEGMAAVAAVLRPSDPAFLHYRDAAFQIARSGQVPGVDPTRDLLLSFLASRDDPIAGGRHKVLGSKRLAIPPQTSTIASHLPKAVGAAYSIGLAAELDPEHRAWPDDAIVVASFGDASVNHASAQAAFNTAGWTAYRGVALPLLFVCEDNGIGISVPTPSGWVANSMSQRAGLRYRSCDGLDLVDTLAVARACAEEVRRTRRPVFLHLSCVRLYGHAGADVEATYRSADDIVASEDDDPLLRSAGIVIDAAGLSPDDVVELYEQVEADARRTLDEVRDTPRLRERHDVLASLVPPKRTCRPARPPTDDERLALLGEADAKARGRPQSMAKLLNWTLTDLLATHPEVVLAGEDIGAKGGVYGVTQRLQARFGRRRVIDTLLDEQSILGLAIGLAHNGFVPIPEIQFLAYLHNAEDQLRGEAATLPFFSDGQFTNPMVVRIAALGYQKGFGGHFHNDNSIAVLRDIPGLIVACPSNGHDAAVLLRESVRLAREEQRVVAFLEPIALYATTDLHTDGDGEWANRYPEPGRASEPPGQTIDEVAVRGEGTDVAIVTYGNGTHLSVRAQRILAEHHDIGTRVIDLRWLAPVPIESVVRATDGCAAVLVVDECRQTGSISEQLVTELAERGVASTRLCAADSFIATGPGYAATLPSCDDVVAAAAALAGAESG
ncbi:MAG: thiamine pyrophosphate-dependent enzyme [Actinomycetota bacterium]